MKILRHRQCNARNIVKCECGCIYEYDESDIYRHSDASYNVQCPDCGAVRFFVSAEIIEEIVGVRR